MSAQATIAWAVIDALPLRRQRLIDIDELVASIKRMVPRIIEE